MSTNLIRLNEVIKELILESHDEDNYLHNTSETQIIFHVRNAFNNLLYVNGMNGYMKSVGIELENGWRLPLPPDFIKYARLSGVDEEGGLHRLFYDSGINNASIFLQDHLGNNLEDAKGNLLEGSLGVSSSTSSRNSRWYDSDIVSDNCIATTNGRNYNLTTGVVTANGQYKLNMKDECFVITDSPYDLFVIDYIADPSALNTEKGIASVTVGKEWKEAIKLKAYFDIISKRRKVPMNEKVNAERLAEKQIKQARLTAAPTISEYFQYLNRTNGGATRV